MYVFEGQQLEKLYDLLEEYISALPNNSELEKTEQVSNYSYFYLITITAFTT